MCHVKSIKDNVRHEFILAHAASSRIAADNTIWNKRFAINALNGLCLLGIPNPVVNVQWIIAIESNDISIIRRFLKAVIDENTQSLFECNRRVKPIGVALLTTNGLKNYKLSICFKANQSVSRQVGVQTRLGCSINCKKLGRQDTQGFEF